MADLDAYYKSSGERSTCSSNTSLPTPAPGGADTLQLRPYQEPCVDGVMNMWKHGFPSIITAQTGAGKTYMGAEAARRWGAEYVIVVGPKASLTKWGEVLSEIFPVTNIFTVTPQVWILCGTAEAPSANQPYTYKYERDGKGYDFYPSHAWVELCSNHRVVFILDEFHMYQKASQRTFAVSACSRFILLHENESRVLCLSHTPSDDTAYIPIHMYLLGMVCQEGHSENPAKAMVEYDHGVMQYNITGLEEVMSYVESMGYKIPEERDEANLLKYARGRGVHTKANTIAGELFLKYIRDKLAFSCNPSFLEIPEVQPVYENIFCKVSEKTAQKIRSILSGGSAPGEEKPITFEHEHASEDSKSSLAALMAKQKEMERIKEMMYVAQVDEFFEDNPTGKAVLMVQFLDSLDTIFESLKARRYNPVRIEGCMRQNARDTSIAAFQAHNLDCRVFIGTLATGGVSIDLHDTSPGGKYPRLMLIPPALRVKDMVQAAGRVFRDGITSKPIIRIIYTADGTREASLENNFYNKVWKKTNTIKRYHATDQKAILPCDYVTYITEAVYTSYVDLAK